MLESPPRRERLGDLLDGDRRLHAHVEARRFEGVLEGEGVDDRRQHAGVVGRRAVHALFAADAAAAQDVAGADDDADLAADVVGGLDLGGDFPEGGGVDAETFVAGKRLPAYLEEGPFATFGHGGWP